MRPLFPGPLSTAKALLPARIDSGQISSFTPGSSFFTEEKFERLQIIIILKGEMLNLHLEGMVAVRASGEDSEQRCAFAMQTHGKRIQKECWFIRLVKA